MCINKLGIALDGYGDGAVLLFRGTEMKHYISHWSGAYRYAFDHTTHQSVEDAIKEHERTDRWGPKKDSATPKAPKGGRKTKKADDGNDGKPDGGDGSGKPHGKTRKRPRDEEEEEEGAAAAPAPKKGGRRAVGKGKRQGRAATGKSGRVEEEQFEGQLSGKGGHNLRRRKGVGSSVEKVESDIAGNDAPAMLGTMTTGKKGRGRK